MNRVGEGETRRRFKGKIERQHQYWQGRSPPPFAAETITTPEAANALQHADGSLSVLANEPIAGERPALLLQIRNP